MSLEENKTIVRKAMEATNRQDLVVLNDFVAPNYVNHTRQFQGRDGYKQFVTTHFNAFPDFHVTVEDIVAEGDKVWVRFKFTGTHTGEYRGLAPTGKKITVECVDIFRMVDGKAVEEWEVADGLDSLKQLSLVEYTEKGKKFFPEGVK